MYSQLGNIQFDKLLTFQQFTRANSQRYAEHARIEEKPRLHRTGEDLETITLSVRIHAAFADLTSVLNELRGYRSNGEVLPFLDGGGNFQGNFVITSMSEQIEDTDNAGAVISVAVSLTLKEFVNEDISTTQALAAKKNAAAIKQNGVIPVRNLLTPVSTGAKISNDYGIGRRAANSSIDLVNTAEQVPGQAPSLLQRAKNRLNYGITSMRGGIQRVKDLQNLPANLDLLESRGQTVADTMSIMAAAASTGDLNTAIAAAKTLATDLTQLDASLNTLNRLVIFKKEIN